MLANNQAIDLSNNGTPQTGRFKKFLNWIVNHYYNFIIFCLIFLLAFVFFFPAIVVFVPAGHGGILWKRFGGGTQIIPALPEGVNIIWPWDKIETYDLRLQEETHTYSSIIANDGLAVDMELTLRYRLNTNLLGQLHKTIGHEYKEVFILPEIGSILRGMVSLYKADELYAFRRQRIQEEIYDAVKKELMYSSVVNSALPATDKKSNPYKGFVLVQDVLIRNVTLPASLLQSIEQKIQQDQLAQEYNFRLRREAFEAQRKQIEASGIQAFQDIVNTGLTDNFLRWRGIEATNDLAQSITPKIVLIGRGERGLPLIFNTGTGENKPLFSEQVQNKVKNEQATVKPPQEASSSVSNPPIPENKAIEKSEAKPEQKVTEVLPLPPPEVAVFETNKPETSTPSVEISTAPVSTPVLADENAALEQEEANLKLTVKQWKKVQSQLNKMGFNAGVVDGSPGRSTRLAIKTWQRTDNRTVTGYLTTDDYSLLVDR